MGGGSKGKQRDYTAPINFVSGGVANKKKEGGEEEEEKDERIGSGESSDEDDRHQYSAGRHIKAGGLRGTAGMVQSEGQFAGQRSHGYKAPQSLGKGFGEWEKHTKGIGASLLLKMGYQPGKGLGKRGEGRVDIVEAHLRKKGAGVGAAGPEGGRPKKVDQKTGKVKGDSDDEEERKFKEKLNQWKQEPGGKKKNVSYVYKSVEEVLQEGQHRKVDRGRGKAGEKVCFCQIRSLSSSSFRPGEGDRHDRSRAEGDDWVQRDLGPAAPRGGGGRDGAAGQAPGEEESKL